MTMEEKHEKLAAQFYLDTQKLFAEPCDNKEFVKLCKKHKEIRDKFERRIGGAGMQLIQFTGVNGDKVSIVAEKITGFIDCQINFSEYGNTFIATGAEGSNGGENGWYVAEKFDTVTKIIQSA